MKTNRNVSLLLGIFAGLTFAGGVCAETGTPGTGGAQAWVAQVKVSRGIVRIERGGQRFPAPVGARLKVEDAVITEANGSVGLIFADNSMLSMGPNGEVQLRAYSYDSTTYMGAFDAYVKQGTVSLQAGNLARSAPDNLKIRTPQADATGNARQFMVNVGGK